MLFKLTEELALEMGFGYFASDSRMFSQNVLQIPVLGQVTLSQRKRKQKKLGSIGIVSLKTASRQATSAIGYCSINFILIMKIKYRKRIRSVKTSPLTVGQRGERTHKLNCWYSSLFWELGW